MFGNQIDPKIQENLFRRIDALGRNKSVFPTEPITEGVNNYLGDSLTQSVWARVYSAVPQVEKNKFGEVIKTNPSKLFRMSSDFESDNTTRINEPLASMGGFKEGGIYRPHNGISSITTEYLDQSILKTTITWHVNNPNMFDDYQEAFLKHGRVILVEFGFSKKRPITIPKIKSSETMLGYFNSIQEKIKLYGGNYFASVGYVSNYSWTIGEQGRYECTTDIMSMGNALFKSSIERDSTHKVPDLVFTHADVAQKASNLAKARDSKRTKAENEEIKKFKEDILGGDFEEDTFETCMDDFTKYIRNSNILETSHGGHYVLDASNNITWESSESLGVFFYGKDAWITWGYFEDMVLNHYFGLYPKDKITEKGDFPYVSFFQSKNRNPEKKLYSDNLCKFNENLYTLDTEIILPGRTVDIPPDYKERFPNSKDKYLQIEQLINATNDANKFEPFKHPDKNKGIIRNMVINTKVLEAYFKGTNTLEQSMKSFWSYVGFHYGGFWEFGIQNDQNDTRMVGVVEGDDVRNRVKDINPFPNKENKSTRNNTNKTFQFSINSKNSLIKDFSIDVQMDSKMASQALYLANKSPASSGMGATHSPAKMGLRAFSALQNIKLTDDEVNPGKNLQNIVLKHLTTSALQKHRYVRDNNGDWAFAPTVNSDKYKKYNEQLSKYIMDDDQLKLKNGYNWFKATKNLKDIGLIYDKNGKMFEPYSKSMLYLINNTEGAIKQADLIIPITCTFSIAGIAGIKLFDYFSIDYLPEMYRKYTLFQVTGVSHNMSTAGWTTTITAMMRCDMDTMKVDSEFYKKDNIMDKIKMVDNVKFLDIVDEILPTRTNISDKSHINPDQKNLTILANEKVSKFDARGWQEEQSTEQSINASAKMLVEALRGTTFSGAEANIMKVFEHPMYDIKQNKDVHWRNRIILPLPTRMKIEQTFNKKYGPGTPTGDYSGGWTLEDWFNYEFKNQPDNLLRVLNFINKTPKHNLSDFSSSAKTTITILENPNG